MTLRQSRNRLKTRGKDARIDVAFGTSTRNLTRALISRFILDPWHGYAWRLGRRRETAYWTPFLARAPRVSFATSSDVNVQALKLAMNTQT